MFENLKLKKALRDFHKRTGIELTLESKSLPEEIQDKADKLYFLVQERPAKAIPGLKELIANYPEIPSFKNHLYNAYQFTGQRKKAEALLEKTIEKHPKYIFGFSNKIMNVHEEKEMKELGHFLGTPRDIRSLREDDSPIHITEYLQYQASAGYYEAIIGEVDSAEDRLNELIELKASEQMVEHLARAIAMNSIKRMAERGAIREEKRISVLALPKITILNNASKPVFRHPEINVFYKKSVEDISKKEIDQIFALPKESLLEDLHLVIQDSIQRWEYFKSLDYEESTHNFIFHALYFLGAIGDESSLKPVLDLLRMGEEFTEYWFSDYTEEALLPTIFSTGKDQLEILKQITLEPFNKAYDRFLITTTVAQIAFHYPERKEEVIDWLNVVLQYHLDHPDKEGIIDILFLSLTVSNIIDLRASSAIPLIERLFENGWIDETIGGDFEDIKSQIQRPFPLHQKKPFPLNIQEYYSGVYRERAIAPPPLSNKEQEEMDKMFNSPAKQAVIEQLTLIMKDIEGYAEDDYPDEMYEDDDLTSYLYPSDEDDFIPTYQEPFKRETPKVGRNAPCPCGSGKKFKRCCMNK